jgi:capsular polysaccharide transport system permease protein
VVDRTDLGGGQSMDLASLFTGARNDHELMLMRDHLRSVDMLEKLDARLSCARITATRSVTRFHGCGLRTPTRSSFMRITCRASASNSTILSGVLRIKAQAYTPAMAQAIASALLEEGERFMNDIAHRLARDQVDVSWKTGRRDERTRLKSRLALVDFQNAKGFLSPQAAADTLTGIVARLEGELTQLKASRETMLGYLSPTAPGRRPDQPADSPLSKTSCGPRNPA